MLLNGDYLKWLKSRKQIMAREVVTLVIICGLLLLFDGMEKLQFVVMTLVVQSLLESMVMYLCYKRGILWHLKT